MQCRKHCRDPEARIAGFPPRVRTDKKEHSMHKMLPERIVVHIIYRVQCFQCFRGSSPARIRPGRLIYGPEALLRKGNKPCAYIRETNHLLVLLRLDVLQGAVCPGGPHPRTEVGTRRPIIITSQHPLKMSAAA